MPEGPEIRREADRIERVLLGRTLAHVELTLPHLLPFAEGLIGTTVTGIDTRGKALLTHFSDGRTLYSHNQLYGKWYVCRRDRPPATNRSLRVGLHTETHSALLMSASSIELLDPDSLAVFPPLARLGPDVLSPGLVWREVAARLQAPDYAGRSLGALYLDQHFIAGIGNYLRSEILFAAGLHPALKPRLLTRAETGALARATLAISQRAYATAGVTNRESWVTRLKRQGLTRRHWRFAVFDRAGEPCHACGTTIERIEVGTRRLYLCPACQPSSPSVSRPR
ncbi:MAG: endonuclease VIII [Pseudomonadales bacterium]